MSAHWSMTMRGPRNVRTWECHNPRVASGSKNVRALEHDNARAKKCPHMGVSYVGKAAAQDNGLSERRILTGLLLLKSSRS